MTFGIYSSIFLIFIKLTIQKTNVTATSNNDVILVAIFTNISILCIGGGQYKDAISF
jgi:hypothetical protein